MIEFSHNAQRAEAQGATRIYGVVAAASLQPQTIRRVRYKRVEGNVVEETEEVETRPPDMASARWLLARRWPDEYGDRIRTEVSGRDGEPIAVSVEVTAGQVLDKLRSFQEAQVLPIRALEPVDDEVADG